MTSKEWAYSLYSECMKSLEELKKALTSRYISIYPNVDETFRLMTDGSAVAISTVLYQSNYGRYYTPEIFVAFMHPSI